MFSRKKLHLLVILDLLAGQISCSAEQYILCMSCSNNSDLPALPHVSLMDNLWMGSDLRFWSDCTDMIATNMIFYKYISCGTSLYPEIYLASDYYGHYNIPTRHKHVPFIASSLQHVGNRQSGNKHFVCSLSGSQLLSDLFVFAKTSRENPVPESGTKILTV